MDSLYITIFQFGVFIFSVIIHEVSHGLMALKLGDETAKNEGRLTLNHLKHIDPIGSIFLPLLLKLTNSSIIFGWAKPVPYNPFNLHKDFKYGPLKVALAGPFSNFGLAVFFALLMRLGVGFLPGIVVSLFGLIVFLNCLLAIFNLIPIPPLDGSKILTAVLPARYSLALQSVSTWGLILLLLFIRPLSDLAYNLTVFLFNVIVGGEATQVFLRLLNGS